MADTSSERALIEVEGLWKVFGDRPDRVFQQEYVSLSRADIQEALGLVVGLRDVSFRVPRRRIRGRGVGFAEVSVRTDYVNGCKSSPVAFLEGIYVRPEFRRHGVARLLYQEAERWGRARGAPRWAPMC